MVVVEVVDPSGLGDKTVVVITASDVNENPVLSGRAELTIAENFDGNTSGESTSPAFSSIEIFDGNTAGQPPTVNVYEVTDKDATCRHQLAGTWWERTRPISGS